MKKLIFSITVACFFAATPAFSADPIVPDANLTPGAVNSPATSLDVLCARGYTKKVRHVSKTTKDAVFREYGYNPKDIVRGDYEIDHLISLELDGSNDIKNLWPESYRTQPLNSHKKDVLENVLHRLVCRHQLALTTAQTAIATDWIAAYNKYVLHHNQ